MSTSCDDDESSLTSRKLRRIRRQSPVNVKQHQDVARKDDVIDEVDAAASGDDVPADDEAACGGSVNRSPPSPGQVESASSSDDVVVPVLSMSVDESPATAATRPAALHLQQPSTRHARICFTLSLPVAPAAASAPNDVTGSDSFVVKKSPGTRTRSLQADQLHIPPPAQGPLTGLAPKCQSVAAPTSGLSSSSLSVRLSPLLMTSPARVAPVVTSPDTIHLNPPPAPSALDRPLSCGWATALAAASIANSANKMGAASGSSGPASSLLPPSRGGAATTLKRRQNFGPGGANVNNRTTARSLLCLSVSNPIRKLSISVVEWKYPFFLESICQCAKCARARVCVPRRQTWNR